MLSHWRLRALATHKKDIIAITRPSSGTFLPRTTPSSYPIPTPYYSPGPGRPPPTRGASLLGPTPAASQTRLLAYSLLLPPSRGGARAAPCAPSCPFSPGAAQWSRHPARARRRPSWPYISPSEAGRRRANFPLEIRPFFLPRPLGEDPSPTRHTREARVGVE